MTRSIPQNHLCRNTNISHPSVVSQQATDLHSPGDIVYVPLLKDPSPKNYYPTRLPKLAYKLMVVMRDDYLVCGVSERLSEEMGARFGVHPVTIRKAWSYLDEVGFSTSKEGGKGKSSKRWITFEGFSFLDNQLLHQTLQLNSPIPYIDLSKKEETNQDLIKATKNCGKVAEPFPLEEDLEPEEALEKLFELSPMKADHALSIKFAMKRTQLSRGKRNEVIARVARVVATKPVINIRSYFMTALLNEEKKQRHLREQFRNAGLLKNINIYC